MHKTRTQFTRGIEQTSLQIVQENRTINCKNNERYKIKFVTQYLNNIEFTSRTAWFLVSEGYKYVDETDSNNQIIHA
jgi:hypothetical protein